MFEIWAFFDTYGKASCDFLHLFAAQVKEAFYQVTVNETKRRFRLSLCGERPPEFVINFPNRLDNFVKLGLNFSKKVVEVVGELGAKSCLEKRNI